jgi:hypothetical protein
LNAESAVFCEPVEEGNWGLGVGNWKAEIESLLADETRRRVLEVQARKDVERLTWVKREERVLKR